MVCSIHTFSQSKKKQIEMLQWQVDSLNLEQEKSSEQVEALRKENVTLRRIMIGYIHQIDTLNQINLKLEQELEEARNLRIRGRSSDQFSSDDFISKNCFPAKSSTTEKSQSILSDLYEVALVDYHISRLQRIFVVISGENVDRLVTIRAIICELKENYPVDEKSNISFFTEKKYANYVSDLFDTGGEQISEEMERDYNDWLNHYYLGEFEFETYSYEIFPASKKPVKKKQFQLEACD